MRKTLSHYFDSLELEDIIYNRRDKDDSCFKMEKTDSIPYYYEKLPLIRPIRPNRSPRYKDIIFDSSYRVRCHGKCSICTKWCGNSHYPAVVSAPCGNYCISCILDWSQREYHICCKDDGEIPYDVIRSQYMNYRGYYWECISLRSRFNNFTDKYFHPKSRCKCGRMLPVIRKTTRYFQCKECKAKKCLFCEKYVQKTKFHKRSCNYRPGPKLWLYRMKHLIGEDRIKKVSKM